MERNRHGKGQVQVSGHIDESTLHAWLDGALPPADAARVEAHVTACAKCGAAAAEARGLIAAASRILTALDDVPGAVAPGSEAGVRSSALTERRRRPMPGWRGWRAWPVHVAAAILFFAAGSVFVVQRMTTVSERPVAAEEKNVVVKKVAPAAPKVSSRKQANVAAQEPRVVAQPPRVAAQSPQVAAQPRIRYYDSAGSGAQPSGASPSVSAPQPGTGVAAAVPAVPRRNALTAAAVGRPGGYGVGIAGGVARGKQAPSAAGCYAITASAASGLPARLVLGAGVHIPPPDSAAFPLASWTRVGADSLRIVLTDTAGIQHRITARADATGLTGQVSAASGPQVSTSPDSLASTSSDSTLKPFAATRCP
jgi:hypothetical protein